MAEHGAFTAAAERISEAWPPGAAAAAYARNGVPVFPCAPGGKHPITTRGFHDATTNPKQVTAWWQQHPRANIGIPTGQASGVVVVDVDVHGPADGPQAFARAQRAGLVSGWELLAHSPSGGLHAYFPADPDTEQRSWQAARAGIDFRGEGGYIIAPPSRRTVNGTEAFYRIRSINTGPAGVVDSGRLRDFLDPRPTMPRRPTRVPGQSPEADVERLAAWVAQRAEGERNRGVFWAACRLAENGLAPSEALDVLAAAGGQAGLSEREVTRTVRSAYRTVHTPTTNTTPTGDVQREGPGPEYVPHRSPSKTGQVPVYRGLS
ncbi:bifunctional DNA primase/polymerase [Nesterenkonia ebinurensis]|uniref:bifunctional DNA primase/polymerase n=1 Tax=Nesterenkonia ebinurensis TaxID=2608252 RepID=UPI00123CA4C7|nr:bifunctional DNA primase/polymerase [Nesterenkonia ebinurensis]